ncbi:MAG: helix-turn-helix domain-containing protein, partial [Bacteroidaceae bacterium]|nr:helix-turn-helix domain-containing protein [Bacteroidaceae bacterium]
MKKILYDNQMFTLQRFGGVTRYFASLMRNLPKDEFVSEIPMQYSENPYIRDINGNDYDKITLPLIYNIRHKIYRLVNKNIAQKAVRNNDYDIFHPTYYDPYFLDAVARINGSYTQSDLSISDICKAAGIGQTTFRQLFRQVYRKTPMDYVLDLRLDRARNLIAGGALVETAALESGFNDPKYFSR